MIREFSRLAGCDGEPIPFFPGENAFEQFFEEEPIRSLEWMNSSTKGIFWKNDKGVVRFCRDRTTISGIPSIEQDRVILVFAEKGRDLHNWPQNAVVVDPYGKVILTISVPKLISDVARQQMEVLGIENFSDARFSAVRWDKVHGVLAVVMTIQYDGYRLEQRLFDPSTGEFDTEYYSNGTT